MAKYYKGWRLLGRGIVATSNFAGALILWSVVLTGLLWTSGCTGMVNGQNNAQSAVQVIPGALDFGSVGVGKQVSHTATIVNNSKTTVTLTRATISATEFSISGLKFPLSLPVGQKSNFTVWYKGSRAGKAAGTLSFNGEPGSTDPVMLSASTASPAQQLTVSPASHNFGNATVNTVANAALTLTNSGGANLTISRIAVSGTGFDASPIKVPATVPAGGNLVLDLTFSPRTTGNFSGAVAVSSDDANTPTTTVTLAGTATTQTIGKLTATPAALNFNNVKEGSTASAVTTLKNVGTANVTLSQINLSGSGFSASGIATPLLVVPGESLTLTVKYSPTSTRTSSGDISLVSAQGGITSVSVFGTVSQSGLTLSPASINFGTAVTGVANTQTVQIANPGSIPVTISAANISGAGFSTSGLAVPLILSAGKTATFNVQFDPKSAGASAGSLSLVSDATNPPSAIALSGAGMAPGLRLAVNPLNVNFGNVNVGTTASRSVTLTNTGNSNVVISHAALTGANLSLSGGSAVTLSPSQSITLTVQYSPTTAASTAGTLAIVSDANGAPSAIPISGNGVTPAQHTVMLSWNASNFATGYNVYRSATSGSGYARVNSGPDGTLTYSDASVQNGQAYYYVTTAVDAAGQESPYSSEVSVLIP
ncbi:MAG TPA: choice-of-anchor D domain-containing protein [Candidatus Acidoferrum sp.]|nr:choice-of-anchor D domain-containing protein [Candidatus Acidoferrum sp.]